MATFIKSKDDKLINLYYVQNIVINPENDKEIIIYNKNGESITESYDTAEEANTAHDNYVTKMEESSGGGSAKLQTKSVTITENGTNIILPDENYDGMSKVNLDVNVQGGGSEYNVKMNTVFTSNNKRVVTNITEVIPPDISGLTDLTEMFSGLLGLTTVPLFDTSKVTKMNSLFELCRSLTTVPLLDTSEVTNMTKMFYQCYALTTIPQFNTSKVTNMQMMFCQCTSLETIPLLDTSEVTSMYYMFQNSRITNLPLLDTSKVTNMQTMFAGCSNLSNQSLNNILQMCINATSYTGTKTLKLIGLSSEQATACQSLSNWPALEAAGWTTGY